MFLFWTFLGAIVANVLYMYVSFNEAARIDPLKSYGIGIFASIIGAISWMYMIRHLKHDHIFLANFFWDILVAILIVILPIVFYGIKLDTKAILGCILAIAGVVLIHMGEAK